MNKGYRIHKYLFLLTICILVVSISLPGCGGGVGEGEEAALTTEDEEESVVTEEEEESTIPILTDGTHRWRLKATTTCGEQEVDAGRGVLEAIEDHVLLQVEFESLSGSDLIDILCVEMMGEDLGLLELYLRGGIEGVYVADNHSNTYYALVLRSSKITFMVPRDEHDFTLHFLDCTPIELGY